MSKVPANALLQRALAISRELSSVAADGDAAAAVALDAERRALLRSVRASLAAPDAQQQALLAEITALNDGALGLLEHRLRAKARDMDMAAASRRALRAYAATG